jgi:hypothetical protein
VEIAAAVQSSGLARCPCWYPGSPPMRPIPIPQSQPAHGTHSYWHTAFSAHRRGTLVYLLTAARTLVLLALDRSLGGAGSPHSPYPGPSSSPEYRPPCWYPAADLDNLIGYITWIIWLVIVAILVLLHSRSQARRRRADRAVQAATP